MLSSNFPILYWSSELEAEYMIDIVGIVYLYDINVKIFASYQWNQPVRSLCQKPEESVS